MRDAPTDGRIPIRFLEGHLYRALYGRAGCTTLNDDPLYLIANDPAEAYRMASGYLKGMNEELGGDPSEEIWSVEFVAWVVTAPEDVPGGVAGYYDPP